MKLILEYIDPVISVNSGQVFLWEKYNNSWYGINGKLVLKFTINTKFREENIDIEYESTPERCEWYGSFFRADDDYQKIKKVLSDDHHINMLFEKYQGLRIIRQDPFQCIISFICASNNNIKRIRKILNNICRLFGKSIEFDDKKFNLFPTSKELCKASITELQNCGLGYRAKYVKAITKKIYSGELNLEYLKKISYQKAKTELIKNFGIGNKTADCILLFSLEKIKSFPIDTWILKSLINNYYWLIDEHISTDMDKKVLSSKTYSIIQRDISNYFGNYSGYAQQYLYYDIRNNSGKKW